MMLKDSLTGCVVAPEPFSGCRHHRLWISASQYRGPSQFVSVLTHSPLCSAALRSDHGRPTYRATFAGRSPSELDGATVAGDLLLSEPNPGVSHVIAAVLERPPAWSTMLDQNTLCRPLHGLHSPLQEQLWTSATTDQAALLYVLLAARTTMLSC